MHMLTMVLSLALAASPQAPAGQPHAEARAQAEQLARAGAHQAALERFQALAAANPDDVEARLWIARLHSWMGHDRRALDVYESIIATHPKNIDALVGAGDAYTRLGRRREAADLLTRAETAAPDNPSVLAAQGRLHAASGRTTLAIAYYQRALIIDANTGDARAELAELQRLRAHRVELGYFLEHFNQENLPNPQGGSGLVNFAIRDGLRLSGTVQHARKFSQNETRGGAGVEWQPVPSLQVHGGALFGGDTIVLPRTDVHGGLHYLRGRATWSFDVRFAEFEQVDVQVGGAGLKLALPRRTAAWVNYYRFATDYELTLSDIVHSWVLGVSGHPERDWLLGAEYTRGPDQLDMLTIDRLGEFETNTYSAFTEFLLTPMVSAHARYDYQDRPEDSRMHRATGRLIFRF